MLDVLWLDDDKKKLRIVQDLLQDHEVEFHFAHSLREAQEELKKDRTVRLLLLDAIVPPARLEDHHGSDADAPDEDVPFGDLEKVGREFQIWCNENDIKPGKTIMISYVPEWRLTELGYEYDGYINKLELPDRLEYLSSVLSESLGITAEENS